MLRNGGLAQLARALAWHARGHRFDSDILHCIKPVRFISGGLFYGLDDHQPIMYFGAAENYCARQYDPSSESVQLAMARQQS